MHAAESGGTHGGSAAHQGAVISVDPDGRVDGWSAGAESILGYDQAG
ncbi:hypothetical protein [Actinacidiphila glaucinigra]|nr:hypothetical protein [Actinacidiphila glaucinigra]